MTVRLQFAAVFAAAGLLLGTGCGGGERTIFTAETEDPNYKEGQRLVKKQGHDAEALSAFLKVIEKRGEQASAESHLEAGTICLYHIKDPVEAIHHFRKYLELQPNSKQATLVRGLIDTATREFARTLPGRPLESQQVGIDQSDLVRQLQRENDDLRAELASQRTAAATQFLRSSRAPIEGNDTPIASPPSSVPIITPAPMPTRAPTIEATIPAASSSVRFPPAPNSATRAARPTTPGNSASGGKSHVVAQGETLFSISRKYHVTIEELQGANRAIVPTVKSPLPRGAELKIP